MARARRGSALSEASFDQRLSHRSAGAGALRVPSGWTPAWLVPLSPPPLSNVDELSAVQQKRPFHPSLAINSPTNAPFLQLQPARARTCWWMRVWWGNVGWYSRWRVSRWVFCVVEVGRGADVFWLNLCQYVFWKGVGGLCNSFMNKFPWNYPTRGKVLYESTAFKLYYMIFNEVWPLLHNDGYTKPH